MSINHNRPHVVVINRWSVGWSGGQPAYEDVLDHGDYQVSYIVDAEGEKGLTDGIKAACRVEQVQDIKDVEQLARALGKLVQDGGPVFRLIALSEWDLLNAAALRARFGIAGLQPDAVLGVRDKVRMKELVGAAGIAVPAFAACQGRAELEAFIAEHGYPVVVKPRKMAASIGVFIIRDAAELEAVGATLKFDDVECETYCPGAVFHVDGLMKGGELVYAVPFRYTRPPVEFVRGRPLGAISLGAGARREALIAFAGRVAAALSIDNTHFHLELILDESSSEAAPIFLEVGARVGGADIPRAVELITGVDAVKQQLRAELGLDLLPMASDAGRCAAYLLIPFPAGLPRRVAANPSLGVARLPTLVDEHLRRPGELLDGTGGYLKIPARFVFRGTFAEVARDLARAEAEHRYEHEAVVREGLLALVHKGLSFCQEIAACARSLGVELFVISSKHDPHAPLASLSGSLPFVHMTDDESLTEDSVRAGLERLEAAGFRPLASIATMESYRLLAAAINARYDAPDSGADALRHAMDKLRARQTLFEAGLSRIEARPLTEELLASCQASGRSYFIKPRRGAASFGAFPLTDDVSVDRIEALQQQIRSDSFVNAVFYGDHSFIIEDTVPGPEFCFELVVSDGELHVVISHGKTLVHTKHSVLEDQMVSPGLEDRALLDAARAWLTRAFQLLALTHGLFHVEMRLTDSGWELIEINTRVGGGLINESGRARLGGTSLLDLWIFVLLGKRRGDVRQRFQELIPAFESAADPARPRSYTFQQYFYGEPGRKIAAIHEREASITPTVQHVAVKVGDAIPDSDREHDVAMAMWSLPEEQWRQHGEAIVREAPRLWDFVYEEAIPEPGPVFAQIQGLLTERQIDYRHVAHGKTLTSEESARARGERLEIGGKALLIKADHRFVVAVTSAARKVDSALLRRTLGASKIRFASPDELFALTGLGKGCLPPFGAPLFDVELVADRALLANEKIAFNAGSLYHSIIMNVTDWLQLARPRVSEFAKDAS